MQAQTFSATWHPSRTPDSNYLHLTVGGGAGTHEGLTDVRSRS
jgi:hypothetical protein